MPATRTEPVIAVESLTKRYGDLTAVSDISFQVDRGEVFAFLGPNGAGKTTTAEIIETIRKPTSGLVRVLGMDTTRRKRDIVRRIGVLPQGFASYDRLTVYESLRYYARLYGVRNAVDELIALTHLQDKRDVQFCNLSGGLKQRLGIAIALVNDPEIVFLDEPSAGLDPRARRSVWDIVLDLKERGKTVFLTTHYIEEAELLADRVAIISHGEIAAIDTPQRLIQRHAGAIRLTLESTNGQALHVVRKMGFDPTQDDAGNVKVRVRDAGQVYAILSALKEAGLALPPLDVGKPNLEEVFLSITGGQVDDEDDTDQGRP